MTVGKSSKTPFKHWILNHEMGRLAGIMGIPSARARVPCKGPLKLIDMCAGDAENSKFSDTNSVAIFCKHMHFKGQRAHLIVLENDPYTFDVLEKNVANHYSHCDVSLLNMDSKDLDLHRHGGIPPHSRRPMLINCDPNSIDQIPLSESFVFNLPPFALMIVTLGCNVNGLKRLKLERRKEWFDYIDWITSFKYSHHDLILVSVLDSSQWAYLITIPKVWAEDSISKYIKKGNQLFGEGRVTAISYNLQRELFKKETNRLFLTKKENTC